MNSGGGESQDRGLQTMENDTYPQLRRRLPDEIDIADLERSAFGIGGESENRAIQNALAELRHCPQCGEKYGKMQMDIYATEVVSSRFTESGGDPALLLEFYHGTPWDMTGQCELSITNGDGELEIDGTAYDC